MGYDTDFKGHFKLDKNLSTAHANYLLAFAYTRRVKRKGWKKLSDPIREAVGLPPGVEGGYYVGSCADGNWGQNATPDVIDNNVPPKGQPGLWCQWTPGIDGHPKRYPVPPEDLEGLNSICWDGGEKFYNYVEWLEYIISHFLGPWGYFLNGEVEWVGEDEEEDTSKIIVKNNGVSVKRGIIHF